MTGKQQYLNRDAMRGGWIYDVVDRKDPTRVRYTGKTQVSVQVREYGHWYDARRVPKKQNSRIVNWLLKRNADPTQVEFREYGFFDTLDKLNQAEVDRISYLRSIGQADLNIADGGDGPVGMKHSTETRKKMSESRQGEKHYNSKMTWEQIRQIRDLRSQEYYTSSEMAKKYGISKANVSKILANTAWVDAEFDPNKIIKPPPEIHTLRNKKHAKYGEAVANEIRELRKREYHPVSEMVKRFGVKRSQISNILTNKAWIDPEFDPNSLKRKK